MKKRNISGIFPYAIFFAAVLFAAVNVTMISKAYFTTYVTAKGGRTVTLEGESQVQEQIDEFDKIISVKNTGEQPCYVRVLVLAGDRYDLDFINTEHWTKSGDYWVYNDILMPGDTTPHALRVHISYPEGQDTDFNVIVIEESVMVSLDEAGNPYANWDNAKVNTEEVAQ